MLAKGSPRPHRINLLLHWAHLEEGMRNQGHLPGNWIYPTLGLCQCL